MKQISTLLIHLRKRMEKYSNSNLAEVLRFYFPNPESSTFLKKFKDNVFLIGMDGRKYVVKEYLPTFTPERLKFFEELQNFTSERMRVPPKVLTTRDQELNVQLGGFGYDLTEFVKNKNIDRTQVKDIGMFFFNIGSFVGNLHKTFSEFADSGQPTISSLLNIPQNTPNHMIDHLKRYREDDVDESWVKIVEDKIAMVDRYSPVLYSFESLQQKIVHGDLYLKNILLDREQKVVGLIDFAQAGTFFRSYEVMRAMVQTNKFFQRVDIDPLYLKRFLKGYLNMCPLNEVELKNMLDLYIFIQASDISFLDIDTVKNGSDATREYAKYRFDSLNSLHRNHQLLTKNIEELIHN